MRQATAKSESVTAPESIARSITRDILSGDYRPGTRLPTIQELAESYHVNPSTMQRAIARLEAQGLVTARQGSGLRVNDPLATGDFSLLPMWVELLMEENPEAAVSLMASALAARRLLVAHLVESFTPDSVRHVRQHLHPLIQLPDASTEVIVRVNEAIVGILLADGNQPCFQLLLTALNAAIASVPAWRVAVFGNPDVYAGLWGQLLDEVDRGSAVSVLLLPLEEVDLWAMDRVASEVGVVSTLSEHSIPATVA